MASGDRLHGIQMDQTEREDPARLWEKDTITEAAFTLRHGMAVETRQAAVDLPPVITFNGRLRVQFESIATWQSFVKEVLMIDALIRQYREVDASLPSTVARL